MDTPGKRITKWREYLNLKPREFEAKTGIPYTTLKTIESDSNKPSYDVLAKLRKAFPQLNIDWIFDEGNMEPMLRDGRTLTPTTQEPESEVQAPATVKRKLHTPMAVVRAIDDMSPEQQAAYYKLRWETAEQKLLAMEEAQIHEETVRLLSSVGGVSFSDASADAADTDSEPPYMVAETNHDYVEAAPLRRRIGYVLQNVAELV
jgi:transcriptional regulator with XRE-family HTH domain